MANNRQSKPIVPVFFGCDERFAKYMLVSLTSLIDHVSASRKYEIHILHTDLSLQTIAKAKALEKPNVTICLDDITEQIQDVMDSLPVRDYYSPSTYFRIVIPTAFPQFDKALYIDADTCIVGDVARLYDIQLGSNFVAAVPEAVTSLSKEVHDYAQKVLGIRPERYFNAGILSINCKKWREKDVLGQFISLVSFYQFVVAQDQDYLNVICKDKVRFLSRRFNMEANRIWKIRTRDQVIVHYAFVAKPWMDINCNYGSIFWKYASKTEDYGEIKRCFASVEKKDLDHMAQVVKGVYKTCLKEIHRPDNFLALIKEQEQRKTLESMPQFNEFMSRVQRA